MTIEESGFAYDVGNMYAVMSSIYAENLKNFYKEFRRAEVVSYNSSDTVTITKQEVRKMLKG